MQDFILSFFLGVVEGLTEFIPVSSTAHLRICEALLRVDLHDGFWKMYTIVIQLGAILALPVYFWRRILSFLATFPGGETGRRNILTHPLSLTMVAFVVTAIPAWALKKQIGQNLENLHVMAWALLIGGVVMWVVDAMFTRVRVTHMEEMSFFQAVCIGAAQILSAVFPGTSRSMSTIAAGQLVGMSRPAALEFSFFLSMPTMTVATLYDLLKAFRPKQEAADVAANLAPSSITAHQWIITGIGFLVSFVVAFIVVAWFMRWVRSRGFAPFAIYRVGLGLVLLILLAFHLL
jgi:undecaprenyl-diphosphatase